MDTVRVRAWGNPQEPKVSAVSMGKMLKRLPEYIYKLYVIVLHRLEHDVLDHSIN